MRPRTRTCLAFVALWIGAWPVQAADDESAASLRQELEAMSRCDFKSLESVSWQFNNG